MSSSTVHRLAMDLAASGLLERNAAGEFGVGMKMWELASRSNPLEEFRRRGLPFLEGVHAAVREHVALSIPDVETNSVLYLERLDRHGTVMNLAEVAGRLDIHTTSSGMAMMAHMPGWVQDRFLAGKLEKTTPATETDPVKRQEPARPDPGAWLCPFGRCPRCGEHGLFRAGVWPGPGSHRCHFRRRAFRGRRRRADLAGPGGGRPRPVPNHGC